MKMKSFHVFLIVLIVVSIVAFAFQGSCTYGPYSGSGLFNQKLPMSKFEGFMDKSQDQGLAYSSYQVPANVPAQNSSDVENAYTKVNGFSGIYGSPDSPDRKDFFYGTSGSLASPSFGYSNSKGFLSLSPEQQKLLTTRGGNATGTDSQIGAY